MQCGLVGQGDWGCLVMLVMVLVVRELRVVRLHIEVVRGSDLGVLNGQRRHPKF